MNIEQTGLLLFVAAIVSMITRRLHLPYTVGLTVAGFALAFWPEIPDLRLTKSLIFTVFLPPLIFEAAFQIPWDTLRRNLLVIGTYATAGIGVAVVVVATGLHYLFSWDWPVSTLLAVLVASTDPVAVLAVFKDAHVPERLQLLVESESLFNDGTVAVLYTIVLAVVTGSNPTLGSAVGGFFLAILGGHICGLAVGGLTILLTKGTDDHLVELTFSTIAAYGSFLLADHYGVSGVIATLTCGVLLGNVGASSVFSPRGHQAIERFWEYVAFVSNSLIFLLIGIRLAHHLLKPMWHVLPVVIILALVGRAVCVYGLSLIFARTKLRVGYRTQHVLFWGGLRGALSLALALGIPESFGPRDHLIDLTFGVVAFSVVVQGITVKPMLKRLKLDSAPPLEAVPAL